MQDYHIRFKQSWWRAMQSIRVRYLRRLSLLLLAGVTALGFWAFAGGDWRGVSEFWLQRKHILGLAVFLHACDILTDSLLWMFILRQLGLKLNVRNTMVLYMTGYAGLLLPIQLGRFARAAECSRVHSGTFSRFAAAEIVLMYFSALSAIAVFVGAALYPWAGVLSVPAALLLVITGLLITGKFAFLAPHLPKVLPQNYWTQPTTFLLAFGAVAGWILNGTVLYLVFWGLPDSFRPWMTILMVTSNLFVGVISGLPGGLGITETYLGAMMYWLRTPPEHLIIAVFAFRICTFWIWIPFGWVALMLTGRWRSVMPQGGQD